MIAAWPPAPKHTRLEAGSDRVILTAQPAQPVKRAAGLGDMDIVLFWACNCVPAERQRRNKGEPMGSVRIVSLLALLSLGGAFQAQAQATGDSAEKAVAALESQWLQAYKTNNPDLVAPLLADKYVDTDPEGKVMNKAQSLADAKATKNTSADFENVQVTVFGDTAIATGTYKGKGKDALGRSFELKTRWTDTWVKMPNGKWQCVASQDTPIS
jgi:ketosteroid isomerase-like protein